MLGGAAATLLGLLFVSVSMNAEIILGSVHQQSRRLAEQAFQNYLAVLVVGLLVCLPSIGHESLGYTLLSISAVWSGWAASPRQHLAQPHRSATRYVTSCGGISYLAGFGMIAYAAVDLVTGKGDQPTYIAVGAMLLLISATIASWELLTKVAEDKFRAGKDS